MKGLFKKYAGQFGEKIRALPNLRGEEAWLVEKDSAADIFSKLKREDGFDLLLNIAGVDNFGQIDQTPRFEIAYELRRISDAAHLRIKIRIDESDARAPSAARIWPTADWHEREVYDMLGIQFDGHPDLKRILMWEGYPYHPMRKDFPLEGKPSEVPGVAFTEAAPMAGGPFVEQIKHHSSRA